MATSIKRTFQLPMNVCVAAKIIVVGPEQHNIRVDLRPTKSARLGYTMSEGELRQNHIYLVSKYGSYLHTHDSLDEDADVLNGTHEVYTTAVANVDEYHKVIDKML